jgi:hypothetical protein
MEFHVRDMADTSALLLGASRGFLTLPVEPTRSSRLEPSARNEGGERGGEGPTKNNEIASLATESIDSPAPLRGRGVAVSV